MKMLCDRLALVIVEAPGKVDLLKARLNELGLSVDVMATAGHIAANPKSLQAIALDNRLRETSYRIREDRLNLVEKMIRQAHLADKIYVATDDDYEGDVIAHDIAWVLGNQSSKLLRCRMRSLSHDELNLAFSTAKQEDFSLKAANGICRRIIDRAIGATFSDYSDSPIAVGRIQSSMLLGIPTHPVQIGNYQFNLSLKMGLAKASIPIYFESDIEECVKIQEALKFGKGKILDDRVVNVSKEPLGYSDIIDITCERLGVDVVTAADLLQEAYEKGKVSYPRAGRVGYSEDAICLASKIAKNNRVEFNPDIVPRKKKSDSPHESPRCLDEDILLGRPLSVISSIDALAVLLARHVLECGQLVRERRIEIEVGSKHIEFALTTARPRRVWTEREQAGFIPYPKDRALLNYMSSHELGRPSTIVSHVKKIIERELINDAMQLTDKGWRWNRHAESLGFNRNLAVSIEDALRGTINNPYDHASSVLTRFQMIDQVMKRIERENDVNVSSDAHLTMA